MPTLSGMIFDVGNYEVSFRHLSGILDKWGCSKIRIKILWDVKIAFQGNSQIFT